MRVIASTSFMVSAIDPIVAAANSVDDWIPLT